MAEDSFRTVNQTLGTSPSVGPLPGNQFIPWAVIIILAWFVGQGLFGLGYLKTAFLAAWWIGTWWVLTGNKPWKFLAKFQSVPQWTIGYLPHQPLFPEEEL